MSNNISNNNKFEEKFLACIILFALGDTIGFKNGIWASKYNRKVVTLNVIHELLYEFIDLGGIIGINLKDWNVSINTLMHMATSYALLESKNFIEECRELYKGVLSYVANENNKENIYRGLSSNLKNILIKLKTKNIDKSQELYDPSSFDNLAAIRTLSIGLFYNGEKNRDQLIKFSILCSLITNNSPIGFLGGLTSSLFASFAIENIEISKWPFLLINILESQIVLDYINEETESDYDKYILNWKKYIELKFKNGNVINIKSNVNILYRSKFYYDNFTDDSTSFVIGYSGYSSVIMAYDCLLDSTGNWEKLVIYSALHFGDTYSVASIAAGLYGAYYGWGDVPNNNLKYLEFRDKLFEIGKNIYKKKI